MLFCVVPCVVSCGVRGACARGAWRCLVSRDGLALALSNHCACSVISSAREVTSSSVSAKYTH